MEAPTELLGPGRLFFEDLPAGRKFVSREHHIDAEEIKRFAAEFDPQPFHLDESAAKHSLFGGLAASGWHTAAITMKLLVTTGVPAAGGIIGVGGNVGWPRPTRPGDVLHTESEIVEASVSKSKPDRGWVTLRTRTLNQKSEVVQEMTARLVVPLRTPVSG